MRRVNIRGILIITYVLGMGVALVLGLAIYQKVTAEERMAQNYLEELEMARTTEDLLELMVGKVLDNSLELVLDENIEQRLVKQDLMTDDYLKNVMNNWLIKNTGVHSMHIVDREGNMLTGCNISTNRQNKSAFKAQFTEDVLQEIDEKEGQAYIGIGSDYINYDTKPTLYIARRINSVNLEKIGYMYFFLDVNVLEEKLKDYLERNRFEIVLADMKGRTLHFGESQKLEETYKAYIKNLMSKDERKAFESLYHHADIESERLQLKLIGKRTSQKVDISFVNIVIAISFINLIFLGISIFVMKEILITPLEEIADHARKITQEENLAIRFKVGHSYQEANLINDALNEMLNKIDELIKEGEEKERVQRVLELSVINHRVNPHFLFNTLNSVNVLIAVEDKATAVTLVKSLAKYYRACLTQENDVNTIAQELVIMNEYVHITQLKNPSLIRTKIWVDENLYSKKIPRMILQTLVENCIKYGIKNMEEPLEIEISIKADAERRCTILSVKDHGRGMEEGIRLKILQGSRLEGKSGFGLRATVKRISLMYQIENVTDIIEISSKIDEYTEVKLYIPWETNKNVQQVKLFNE